MVTDVKLTVTAAFSYFTLLIFSFPKLYYVTSPLTSWGCTKLYHSASAFTNVTSWIIQMNICVIWVLRKEICETGLCLEEGDIWVWLKRSCPPFIGGRYILHNYHKGCRPRKFCCGSVVKAIACKTRFLDDKHCLSVAFMLKENQLFFGPSFSIF